jgi:hypothetical protein
MVNEPVVLCHMLAGTGNRTTVSAPKSGYSHNPDISAFQHYDDTMPLKLFPLQICWWKTKIPTVDYYSQ